MSPADFEQREDEILSWAAAGGKDGESAPPGPKRPDDHVWTLDEVRSLTPAEWAANEQAITAQVPALGAEKAAERRTARAGAGRGGYLT